VRQPSSWPLRCALILAAIAVAAGSAQQTSTPAPSAAAPAPSAPASGQQEQPAPQPPRFRTEANYVRVDAYPTRDGQPVQDLRVEDFELLEDGEVQKIAAFEHVAVAAAPETSRVEPGSVREAERQAGEARRRVFVIFLDIASVGMANSRLMQQPLKTLIERIVGPDDLVGLATAYMAASEIALGRRTEIIERGLMDTPFWGVSDTLSPVDLDERERMYDSCFPPQPGEGVRSVLAAKMIARRRERLALSSLRDVAIYLGSIREERKAIITVTEGWPLYTEDQSMLALRGNERPPGPPPIGVGPEGRLTMNPNRDMNEVHDDVCNADRMTLAMLDDQKYFRDLLQDANRANASYYPINAGGLQVFDQSFGPSFRDVSGSMAAVRSRVSTLRELAENTDGLAIVDTNDLAGGMRRIVDDLSSYYLLGYYSSNSQLDGGFRRITVRVKRPGVQVRARRGYRAATAAEVSAARSAAAPPTKEASATTAALATLARLDGASRLRLHAVAVRDAAGRATALWIAGELKAPLQEFASGANATIELSGGEPAAASASIAPQGRTFLVRVPVPNPGPTVDVRVRLGASGSAEPPLTESIRVSTDQAAVQPLLFRRGPATGNRLQPAADRTFSRTERLRLELPVGADAVAGAGRLLDRNGQPRQVPIQLGERTDADGQRWLTADAVLSPLAAADYVVELGYTVGGSAQTILTAVRVTR
jgi:VWFA-related protein